MPNFDAGHYFYTGLVPVDLRPTRRADNSITSHSHLLREVLAELPNFSAEDRAARPSPFSRCRRTHFARFAMIDDPAFNGRVQQDAIVAAVMRVDLLEHQPVDHLSRSWLVFVADADAADGSDASRDAWARGLWEVMEPELRAIFRHCLGFAKVDSADSFAAYLAKAQIETTMSFNDYWIDMPDLPLLSVPAMAVIALVPAVVIGLAAAYWRWGMPHWPRHFDGIGILLVLLAFLLGLALGVWILIRVICARGAKPYPTGPGSDLPGVLKSLFVQQRFTGFAIAQQGASPEDLHAAFGRFIAEVRPEQADGPTQSPGVVP
jgi:hypothetical protein